VRPKAEVIMPDLQQIMDGSFHSLQSEVLAPAVEYIASCQNLWYYLNSIIDFK
jgi:hypothetical protein